MAYISWRRAPRCFTCRAHDRPLYILHGSTGACIGILCGQCAAEWLLLPDVTAHALGNLRRRRPRRRHTHPATG